MKCTNCGALVDDKSIFCPVCGNKMEKSTDMHKEYDDVIEKSTYESVKNNENLIEEKSQNKKSKDNKVSSFISNLVKKNNQNSKEDKNIINSSDNNLENKNDDLSNKINSSKNISKSSPIINQSKVVSDKVRYDSDTLKDEINKKGENNLSAQARIANKIGKEKGFNNNAESVFDIKYDDIPKEYVEARIARQILSKNRIRDLSYNNEKAIKSGNICGVIRNNQKPSFYTGYDSSYHVSTKNFNEEAPPPKEESFEVNPKFKTTSLAVVEEAKKKKHKFKFKPIYLIPILIVLAGLIAAYFFTHKKAPQIEVDLSDYIDVAYNGDDGAASPSASLNTSKLLSDYGNQIAYKNKDRKKDEFSSAANQFVSELENGTTFQYSKDNGLSNGEEITVVANITDSSLMEDYNVMFTNTMKSAIVDNLITSEHQDPFEYIDVSFSGESPNISLTANLKEDAPEYMANIEIAPSKTTDLSSGEEVNVSLIYDED
ncbi:MAG: zinc ribbon domain-containing protein, partial [Anaerococcus sp.]|uniref:zinc ribbon domain-containing protein n=1 Tax=Anaerococcus sp. TaxID=1872515 RepID=UPI0028FE8FCF